MRIAYYQSDIGYTAVTDETPDGPLNGIVYVCWTGDSPETVKEQALAVNQIQAMTKVKAEDVPDEWFDAFGLEKRPEPPPPPPPEPTVTEVVVEFPGDKFRRKIRSPLGTPEYYKWKREQKPFFICLAISAIINWYLVFGRHMWP